MAPQKTIQEEVQDFLAKLPLWQRYLLGEIRTGVVKETEIAAKGYDHLLKEVGLVSEKGNIPVVDLTGLVALSTAASGAKTLRLLSLKNFENVNAIRAKQLLTFGPQITVIYGDNGSGKSGFARIFNNVFYTRGDRSILANVFVPKTNLPVKATFTFQDGKGEPYDIDYSSIQKAPESKLFAVFDSKSVQIHVGGGNEIYVPPNELAYFERLAAITAAVAVSLDSEIQRRQKPNELSMLFEGISPVKARVEKLDGSTELEKVKAYSELSAEDTARILVVDQELAKLKLQDIDKRKKEISAFKESLTAVKTQMTLIQNHYLLNPVSSYQEAIDNHQSLRKKADDVGISQFSDEKFSGIGSTKWKLFLESAHAHAGEQPQPYPKPDAPCLLCRQDLTADAAALIERYWAFLKGAEEKQVKASQDGLKLLKEKLTRVNHRPLADDSSLAVWINSVDTTAVARINALLSGRQAEAGFISSCIDKIAWSDLIQTPALDLSLFDPLEANLEVELSKLDVDAIKTTKEKLQLELATLKHREKLKEHYPAIEAFVLNCRWLDLARAERKKITPRAITDIHKKLHEELLNKKYIQLFHQECTTLKAPFKIDLEQRGNAGKTKRYISVEGIQSGQVLSEGEQRAIAMADFFTEVEMSGISAGLIFDDPVNSLDHVRRDIIARRLTEAAKTRQVIVYTHDLSFLYDLRNAAAEEGVDLKGHWVERSDDPTLFETGIIHIDCAPISEAEFANPTEAEQCLKEARSAANPNEKAKKVKDGMSNLRTSYEAFILTELFAGTVSRFDKNMNHSRFEKTYAPREYVELVAQKLKSLSGFITAHLHSNRSAGALPTTEHLAQEIREYQEMKGKFKADRKAALSL